MRVTLYTLYQPARNSHAGHTDSGGQQNNKRQLVNQRQRR